MHKIDAYPLHWPSGWPRTPAALRRAGKFKRYQRELSVYDGVERVLSELERLGVKRDDMILSTNIPTRLDGLPRSDRGLGGDGTAGVAVYWEDPFKRGRRQVMAIDLYLAVADNLAAIAATLEAMRAIERHGGAQILERAFSGFAALPDFTAGRPWRDVLGDCASLDEVDRTYRRLASDAHPDRNSGDAGRMAELNRARVEARREFSA